MCTNHASLLTLFLLLSPLHGAPVLEAVKNTTPFIIDDAALLSSAQTGIGKYAESKEGPSADELAKQIKGTPAVLNLEIPKAAKNTNPDASVYIITSVYLCGKCEHWHPDGTATAWALTRDGLMVSNYHVFAGAKGGALGVCGIDGKTHRVIEVLAADETNDIAIFRVDSKDLIPLEIGSPAPVGEELQVVSNPDRKFFSHTYGRVSRYHSIPTRNDGKRAVKMSITADYAKGSSGGPVLDSEGRVVGMVSSTTSIYYESTPKDEFKGALQMVVKNCVPVSCITDMFGTAASIR